MGRRGVRLLLAVLLSTLLTACGKPVSDPSVEITMPVLTSPASPAPGAPGAPAAPAASTAPAPSPAPVPAPAPSTVERKLAGLRVTERPAPASDYRRSAFGRSWADIDRNGCNQRDDVLVRDAVKGSLRLGRQGRCDHDVLAGTWRDPYAGREHRLVDMKALDQAQAIQIDHVVPLAEAWVSGARRWPERRRERFGNWLPGLLAVDGPTNASKGASDPAAWRPRKAYQCAYAVRWVNTKHHWQLSADASEVRALREMLAYC